MKYKKNITMAKVKADSLKDLGFKFKETRSEKAFTELYERIRPGLYNYIYQVGWVKFSDIAKLDLNSNPNISFIVMPQNPKLSAIGNKSERKLVELDYL